MLDSMGAKTSSIKRHRFCWYMAPCWMAASGSMVPSLYTALPALVSEVSATTVLHSLHFVTDAHWSNKLELSKVGLRRFEVMFWEGRALVSR